MEDCKHEWGDIKPNGYRECRFCHVGQMLELEELIEHEIEKLNTLTPLERRAGALGTLSSYAEEQASVINDTGA